jgi:DNA-binding NarL/FixJ family response regulator
MKILVAEDSDMLRKKIIDLFSGLDGIKVVAQARAEPEALLAISNFNPDTLVLDVQIILGRGIAVLRKIKRENPGMVVIILTNFTALPYRKKCLEAGADFFLDKSTEFGRLREIVQSLSDRLKSKSEGYTAGVSGEVP